VLQAEIRLFKDSVAATVDAEARPIRDAIEAWEASFQKVSRGLLSSSSAGTLGTISSAASTARRLQQQQLASPLALADIVRSARDVHRDAVSAESRLHGGLEGLLDSFEAAMVDLLAQKVLLHEAFFRAAEGLEGTWFTEALRLGEQRGCSGPFVEHFCALSHRRHKFPCSQRMRCSLTCATASSRDLRTKSWRPCATTERCCWRALPRATRCT